MHCLYNFELDQFKTPFLEITSYDSFLEINFRTASTRILPPGTSPLTTMANASDGGKGDPPDPPNAHMNTDAIPSDPPSVYRDNEDSNPPHIDQVMLTERPYEHDHEQAPANAQFHEFYTDDDTDIDLTNDSPFPDDTADDDDNDDIDMIDRTDINNIDTVHHVNNNNNDNIHDHPNTDAKTDNGHTTNISPIPGKYNWLSYPTDSKWDSSPWSHVSSKKKIQRRLTNQSAHDNMTDSPDFRDGHGTPVPTPITTPTKESQQRHSERSNVPTSDVRPDHHTPTITNDDPSLTTDVMNDSHSHGTYTTAHAEPFHMGTDAAHDRTGNAIDSNLLKYEPYDSYEYESRSADVIVYLSYSPTILFSAPDSNLLVS